ncbi:MAG: methyltransferase domain-containing protein [Wenzhouxiangellaceae bacterium]|nr:methyltransferase domain-containing protein [Wenzhouxiangellaceae bacterium]
MRNRSKTKLVPALGLHWLTPLYDLVVHLVTREQAFKRALLNQLEPSPGDVLDVGCGTGTLAVEIARSRPDARVSGIDADPRMLAKAVDKARRAGVRVTLDKSFAQSLPHDDGSFDYVFSTLFFHHLSGADKPRVLAEVMRVLRPGGTILVADWDRPANPLMHAMFFFVRLFDGFENTRDNFRGRLPALCSEAGFTDLDTIGRFNTIAGTIALYRALKPAGTNR